MGKLNQSQNESTFEACPEGTYRAVCCDVVDLGYVENFFEGKSTGYKPTLQLVYQVDADNSQGKPYQINSRRYTMSTDDRASFRKDLDAWLTKSRFQQMLDSGEFDTEDLLGMNAFISVVFNTGKDGKTYSNIGSIMPLPRGMEPITVRDYERRHLRTNYEAPPTSAFDEPEVARRRMQELAGQQTIPQTQAAPVPATQQPTTQPLSQFIENNFPQQQKAAQTAPQAVSQAEPISTDMVMKISQQAAISYGANAASKVEELCQKRHGRGLMQLFAHQAATILDEVRSVSPTQVVMNTAGNGTSHKPVVEDDESYSPFADEGEPGWRPEGHPDRVAFESNGVQQPALMEAGAAYPAN